MLFRLALIGVVALAAIAPAGCTASGAGSAASSSVTSASASPPGAITGHPTVRDLVTMLTRSGVGPGQVALDLTYAPPMFFEVTALQPPAEMNVRPTLAFMLQETIHDGVLPAEPPAVLLELDTGARVVPYDVEVTATDPHHRTTRLLFPDPGDAFGISETAGRELALTLVVPFTDGTVSAANTFVWQLPINLGPAAPSPSLGVSR